MISARLNAYLRPTFHAFRRRVDRIDRMIDRRIMTVSEFKELLHRLGIQKGAVVMVHSSMDAVVRRVPGLSAVGLVRMLQKILTIEGTLLMPAFPFTGKQAVYVERTRVFDVRRTPSQSGLLTEVFRRMPDVRRSLHPTHSIAGWGKHAEELLSRHHLGGAFGTDSPIYRLRDHGGLVIGLGTGLRSSFTILHVAEEIHPKANAHFFQPATRPMTILHDGVELKYALCALRADVRRNYDRVERVMLQEGILQRVAVNGLYCIVADAKRFIDRSIELVDAGRYL